MPIDIEVRVCCRFRTTVLEKVRIRCERNRFSNIIFVWISISVLIFFLFLFNYIRVCVCVLEFKYSFYVRRMTVVKIFAGHAIPTLFFRAVHNNRSEILRRRKGVANSFLSFFRGFIQHESRTRIAHRWTAVRFMFRFDDFFLREHIYTGNTSSSYKHYWKCML